MKNLIILFAVAQFTLGASCKKENLNDLPPATTTGKNIIGGYIDGQLFVSRRADLLSTDPNVSYYPNIPKITFGGTSVLKPIAPAIGFSITENLGMHRITITPGGKNSGGLIIKQPSEASIHYISDSGFIEFTRFDPAAKIYSGTFDVVFKSSSGKTIHFTEGRFDLLSF